MSSPFLVFQVTRGSASESQGGSVKVIHALLAAQELVYERNFRLQAIFGDGEVSSFAELSAMQQKRGTKSPALSSTGFSSQLRRLARFALSFGGLMFHLERTMRREGKAPAVIHAHDVLAPYLCLVRYGSRYPLVVTAHGKGSAVAETVSKWSAFRGTPVEKVLREMEKTVVKRASVLVFPSRGAQELMEKEYQGLLDHKDVRVVYNGIDTRELDSVCPQLELAARYGITPGTFMLLCVAHLVKEKGADVLLGALRLLPAAICTNLQCLIVGGGHLREKLQSLIVKYGIQERAKLLGLLAHNEVVQLMKSATIFVLPSRVAVFDYALLEAGAIGLPIITTAVGGNQEMFDQDSALLVPPDDPQALAAAIARLLSDEALRKRLGESAYHRIRSRFSLEAMFNAYAAIYQELAGPRASAPEGAP